MDWLGKSEMARRIEEAVVWSLEQGITTPDLGGCCTTRKVTEAITSHMREMA
jgi:methanogen homoisocitrate dehydrogenase